MRRLYLDDPDDAPDDKRVLFDGGKAYVEVDDGHEMRVLAGVEEPRSPSGQPRRRELAAQVPEGARSIAGPQDAPTGAQVVQGPKGGWYYVPVGQDAATPDAGGEQDGFNAEVEDILAGVGLPENTPEFVQARLDDWGTMPPVPGEREFFEVQPGDLSPLVDRLMEWVYVDGELAIVYDFPEDGGVEIVYADGDDWHIPEEELADYEWEDPASDENLPGGGRDPLEMVSQMQAIKRVVGLTETLNDYEARGNVVPEAIDIRQAEDIKGLWDMGIKGGINEGSTSVAVMPDGRHVFIKEYGQYSHGSGEVGLAAHRVLDAMGVNVPLAMYDEETGLWLAEGVENGRPMHEVDWMDETLDYRAVLRAIVGGALVGNGDMHEGNVMMDRRGRVWLIDNDLAGQRVVTDTGDVEEYWARELARRLNQNYGAGTVEEVNDMAKRLASKVPDDLLDELWRSEDDGHISRMAETIMVIKGGVSLIPPDGDGAEEFNRRVDSPDDWYTKRGYGGEDDDY